MAAGAESAATTAAQDDARRFEKRWESWLLERNRRGMRTLLYIVLALYPAFGLLDPWVVRSPRALPVMLAVRALVTLLAIALLPFVRTEHFAAHPFRISSLYMLLCAFGISMMTMFAGGLGSPYYAGLTLAIVATGLLFVWPTRVVVVTHVLIVLSFILPNLFTRSDGGALAQLSNLAFLLSTALIAGVGQVLAFRSQREQVMGRVTLEETTGDLARAHEQLKQLDSFRTRFFANLTHELKAPLALILSPLELLLDGLGTMPIEGERVLLQSMFRSGLKLLKLLGDLLDLTRLEHARLRLDVAERDLVAYLRGLVTQVEPLARRKRIELRFEASLERAPIVCDLDRLERAFVNLLSNAAKFTPVGGHVTVRIDDAGDRVRIAVEDDGPGIPAAMAERVFERFVQLDMGSNRRHSGAGIGLALARELVELHGGRISCESDLGAGARFVMELRKGRAHLPLDAFTEDDAPEGGDDEVDFAVRLGRRDDFRLLDVEEVTERRVVERDRGGGGAGGRRYTVLVVDDSPDIVRLVDLTLRQEFRVIAATDGKAGLEAARREPPDLVVTDLMMPEIDGIELTRRLREEPRLAHVPIVMLTARGGRDDRIAGLEGGVSAYLGKPFSARELLTTVRSLLDVQERQADVLMHQRMDSLETVTAGLAHEINNPLNYLKNALVLIRRDVDEVVRLLPGEARTARLETMEKRMRKMFDAADSGVRRIAGTVELMVRFGREGYTREVRGYDVFEAVRDALDVVVPATGREVRVETSFSGDGTVECVPEEVNQVLTNLIQNGVEATPVEERARLVVRGTGGRDDVTLVVRDHGRGIPLEVRDKLFTPFYTTKEPGRGMGLGLTIVWRVVRSLGGAVSVDSEPGAWTEFTVRLPRAGAKASAAARRPSTPEETEETGQRHTAA